MPSDYDRGAEAMRKACLALCSETYTALMGARQGHNEAGECSLAQRASDEQRGITRIENRIRALALPPAQPGEVQRAERALIRCVARTVKRTRAVDIGRWYEVEQYYDAWLAAEAAAKGESGA